MSNPHDRFFKHTFNDPEKVLGTLEGALSPALFARLRPETLRPVDTRYVDPRLKEYFSDLVYTCLTREDVPVWISFLFEHKSYPVEYPHLQILRYMLEIWDRQVQEKQPLSLIIPILLYHGREAWEYRPFEHVFAGELADMSRYLPRFDFEMINLQAASFEEIGRRFQQPALRIAFRLMKAIRDEDMDKKMDQILEGLPGLEKVAGGYAFFYTIFVYLLNGSKINFEKVMKSMYNLIPEEWVEMYEDSPAMELIRRGREEARAEAEAKLAEAEREIAAARYSAAIEAKEKAEAERKETEARRKETEARRKEAEARQQAREKSREKAVAIKKAITTQKKAEAEKRFAIQKMLEAGIEKSSIATFLGLSRQKLAAYIRLINNEQ